MATRFQEGERVQLGDATPVGNWYSARHLGLGDDVYLAVRELVRQHGREVIHDPLHDETFRQKSPTTRVEVCGEQIQDNLPNGESALRRITELASSALAASAMPFVADGSKRAFWEIMHYRSGSPDALEAHVDRHLSVVVPVDLPLSGGELVVARAGRIDIEADPYKLVIAHEMGRALFFTGGLLMPHYVREFVGGSRTVLVANIPVLRNDPTGRLLDMQFRASGRE